MAKFGIIPKRGAAVSLLLSCLAHALVFFYVIGPYIDVAMQREEMVLKLKEQLKKEKTEARHQSRNMSMTMTRRVSGGKAASPKTRTGSETGELPERVDFAPESEDRAKIPEAVESKQKENTLRRVRSSIASVWRKADPPCPGIAELRLKVAPSGELVSIWITRLKGQSKLGEYMRGLLAHAAPYSGAMRNATRPVVFDCRFEICGPRQK